MRKYIVLFIILIFCLSLVGCGAQGLDGKGIKEIKKTGIDGNIDTYTIYFTDGSTYVYTVTNGKDGIINEEDTNGLAYYLYDDDTYGVGVGTTKYLSNIVIPSTHNGKPVKTIIDEGFKGCFLTSITIPNSVKNIGNYAFYNCSSLISITIPDSVTSIGDAAFSNCSSLTSVTFSDSLTSIGNSAFSNCKSLTSITVPDSVTSIGDSAFEFCSNLTSITISDSVTSIGDYAFYLSGLTSITIPDSVTSIGNSAFSNCPIEEATIPAIASRYISNNYLEKVVITSGTSIGDYAFSNCKSLASITIPDSVTSIGNYAFCCSGLTSFTIPDSITSIGDSAFYNCTSLTSITIPDSVTSIGGSAFSVCPRLTSITYNGTKSQWNSIDKDYYWNKNTGNYVVHCTDGDIAK